MFKLLCFGSLLSFQLIAAASYGSLVSSDTSGSNKYCKYSNGVVVTIKSYEVCPSSTN